MRGSHQLLLLLVSLAAVRADIFHHYHLKKFVTYVAFARALMKRPTILPIPIPIPIPIAQNEVIKLPASSAKSFLTVGGHPSYSTGGRAEAFTGSSDFGYSIPGTFDGGSSLGGSNIMVLDSNSLQGLSGGEDFASSSSNVMRLVSRKPQFLKLVRPMSLFGFGKKMGNPGGGLVASEDSRVVDAGSSGYGLGPKAKGPIPIGERFRLP